MTSPRSLLPRPLSRRDLAVAVVVTLIEVLRLRTGLPAPEPSAVVGALGLLLSLAQGVPLLWRRQHPATVLAVVTAAFMAYALLLVPVPPYGAWVALATLAVRREVRTTAVATAGLVLACAVAYLPTDGPADDVLLPSLLAVGVAVSAQLVRERTARATALADRAAAEERLRIARDLHDVLGHSLSGIAVQSSTGRLALDAGRPDAARDALVAIETASRDSMREVRAVLGALREEDDPGLGSLDDLVRAASTGGVEVALRREGDLDDMTAEVGRTVYRVVQEGLTNVTRHAGPCRAEVTVRRTDDGLEVTVVDDGRGSQQSVRESTPGHGLMGMRERVVATGGELRTGPVDGGGWSVRARLPLTHGKVSS